MKSNVRATCRASLSLWADPLVEYATNWLDFSIGDLVCSDSPVSFYITTPQAHANRLAFLVRVFTRQAINSLIESEHHDSRRQPKKRRLLLLLDEFPKLRSLPFLENAMGEIAGYGITAHLVCQSFNDVVLVVQRQTPLCDNMHITATPMATASSSRFSPPRPIMAWAPSKRPTPRRSRPASPGRRGRRHPRPPT